MQVTAVVIKALSVVLQYGMLFFLLLLVIVNTVTQIILNVLLNIINFRSGCWAFVAWYIMLELAIFTIEAALYTAFMKKLTAGVK